MHFNDEYQGYAGGCCPIDDAHKEFGYRVAGAQNEMAQTILDRLIPEGWKEDRKYTGKVKFTEQCSMFIEKSSEIYTR